MLTNLSLLHYFQSLENTHVFLSRPYFFFVKDEPNSKIWYRAPPVPLPWLLPNFGKHFLINNQYHKMKGANIIGGKKMVHGNSVEYSCHKW